MTPLAAKHTFIAIMMDTYVLNLFYTFIVICCIPMEIDGKFMISNSAMGHIRTFEDGHVVSREKRTADDEVVSGLTDDQRLLMLSLHNQNRMETTPSATNMRYMVKQHC